MTIKEVCRTYDITADTLRYYEKIGVIPAVHRSSGGIRHYSEEDIAWIRNAVCMRNAGMSVERLAEYVRLVKQGEDTLEARRDLLLETRQEIRQQMEHCQRALERLDYKIEKYNQAIRTGVLVWDKEECE